MPPSPWIGSKITAAVSLSTICFIASTSLKGTWNTSGRPGRKGFL